MGIKFLCPNGHKLNVKTFLSGKRAICPKCGARVIVPAVSDPSALASAKIDPTASSSVGAASTTIEIVADESCAELTASPATRIVESASRPAPAQDAISEAPGAVWYVRPAAGGQFGPASADIMRSWLNDGRVSASSLVWRAGWADWQTAAAIFPQLASESSASSAGGISGDTAPPPPLVQPSVGTGGGGAADIGGGLPQGYVVQTIPTTETAPAPASSDSGASPLSLTVRRRRRQRDVRLYTSAVLAVVSVILMIVLFVVFRRGEPAAAPDSATAEPTADSLMQ